LKLIKATVGWSLEEWHGYVYLAQQTAHRLIDGTRSERQQYLSALFNLQGMDRLHLHFKEKADSLDTTVERYRTAQTELSVKMSLLQGRSSAELDQELHKAVQELTEVRKELAQAELVSRLSEERKNLMEKIGSAVQEDLSKLRDLLTVEQEHQAERQTLLRALQTLEVNLATVPDEAPLELPPDLKAVLSADLPDEKWLLTEIQTLEALDRTTALPSTFQPPVLPSNFQEVLRTAAQDAGKLQREIKQIQSRPPSPQAPRPTAEQLESAHTKLSSLQQEARDLERRIERLKFNKAECDQCGTVLDTANRAGELGTAQTDLESVQDAVLVFSKKRKALLDADSAWRAHDALGPDRSEELPELQRLVDLEVQRIQYQELEGRQNLWQARQEAEVKLKALPEFKQQSELIRKRARYRLLETEHQEHQKRKESFQALRQKQESLTQKLADLPDRAGPISTLQARIVAAESREVLKKRLVEVETELGSLPKTQDAGALSERRATLEGRKGQIEQEKREIDGLVVSIQKLQAEIQEGERSFRMQQLYGLLAKGYGKAGILRERQLSKFSSYLESALRAHTLKQLPKHMFRIQVDDGIDIEASKDGGRFYDVKFMSGGEKGALSVAFLFALDDLLPPDRRTNLKILDEIEGAFDAAKQQDFTATTLPRLKERVETLVVISHSAHADAGVFDRTWEIQQGAVVDTTGDLREWEIETPQAV
jgi:DNA repair exonuclease SbcCD ATPase subunit